MILLDKLHIDFREIIQMLNTTKVKFDNINVKIKKLKDVYDELTTTNQDPIYIFGLDFLNFQYKIFYTQYKNLLDLIKLINNRIYGDYYKLNELILNYICDKIEDKVFLANIQDDDTNLPIYKDLDEYIDYSNDVLISLNSKVITMLKKLNLYCLDKDKINEKHQKLSNSGFFLDNFLHSFETNNNIIKNQLDLYCKNIEFFNKNHHITLKTIYNKVSNLYDEIIQNINFDDDVQDSPSNNVKSSKVKNNNNNNNNNNKNNSYISTTSSNNDDDNNDNNNNDDFELIENDTDYENNVGIVIG